MAIRNPNPEEIEDARATAKTVILDVLASHGGECITAENGHEITGQVINALLSSDVIWATKILIENKLNHGD